LKFNALKIGSIPVGSPPRPPTMAFAPSPQPRFVLPLLLRLFAPGFYGLAALAPLWAATTPLVVRVNDWAAMPLSGDSTTASGIRGYMARVNFMRPEPGGLRLWICDLNGNLYLLPPGGSEATRSTQLLDQARNRTAYLDFNGQSATSDAAEKAYVPNADGSATTATAPHGLFPLFTKKQGYANGLVTFEFDPGYVTNGKFYTVHIELVSADGAASRLPVTTRFPGFNAGGYTSTPRINPPANMGTVTRQAVLVEWTDTDRSNLTFEGTAREILRLGYNSHIHPLGDITFNPAAKPDDPEWGVMYLANGDGGSGETNATKLHPQRLDTMVGKILRIIPDLSFHTATSSLSANLRYRIPNDNPFAGADFNGARKEVWTLGHRNPHRFSWHVPDEGAESPVLLVTEIGLKGWEEVNILKRGRNYGYSDREGPQKLAIGSGNSATYSTVTGSDTLNVRLSNLQNFPGEFVPEYPVIAYPQTAAYGDAITNGFFYRGAGVPALRGKYVFGDITTGRVWACDWDAMLAADDGNRDTRAEMQPVTFLWDDPNDSPDEGLQSYDRLFDVMAAGYDARDGVDPDLPGGSSDLISGPGRADIRLAQDTAGELYVTSKSDGMIRSLGSVFTAQPVDRLVALGADTTFAVAATADTTPTYQWQRLPEASETWVNVTNNSVFSGATTATLSLDSPGYEYNGSQFRCVATCAGAQAISSSARLDLRAIPDSWLSTYFNATERADAAISGDLADPDRDGLVNLLEYAFAFNPEADSSAVMPKIERAGSSVKLVFPVPRATLNYTVQKSTNLSTWSTSGITLSTSAGKTTATVPLTSGPETFLRIVVTPQ
jgi:hypothetical protein